MVFQWMRTLTLTLTLSIPSSKSTFSQPLKEKCICKVVRIGSKLWNAKFIILCNVIFLVRLQGKLITLGSERVDEAICNWTRPRSPWTQESNTLGTLHGVVAYSDRPNTSSCVSPTSAASNCRKMWWQFNLEDQSIFQYREFLWRSRR